MRRCREREALLLGLAISCLLALGPACDIDLPDHRERDVWACQGDQDCTGGYVCIGGLCNPAVPDLGPVCEDKDNDGATTCDEPVPDCDDDDPTVNPGASEVCNGVDDNCAGGVDEELTQPCAEQRGVCSGSVSVCTAGVWQACEQGCPGADCAYGERYVLDEGADHCDGFDNDCDDGVDEGCCEVDAVCGFGCVALPYEACPCQGRQMCNADGTPAECMRDGAPAKNPTFNPADEVCGNGLDDNCNGSADEGC